MLPKPNYDHGSDPALVLIFELSLLNFVAEYKLICAVQSINLDAGYDFVMYTSQAGSWKCLDEVYFGTMNLSPMSGVYVNGSIYWKATNAQILVFDLSIQRTRVLYGSHQILGVMDGKLCSTRDYYGNGITVFELSNAYTNTMEMKSRAKAWVQKHQINVGPSPRPSGGAEVDNKSRSVLFAGGNWVVFTNGAKLYAYDIKTKATQCLPDGVEHDFKIVSYVNSLVEI